MLEQMLEKNVEDAKRNVLELRARLRRIQQEIDETDDDEMYDILVEFEDHIGEVLIQFREYLLKCHQALRTARGLYDSHS